MNARKKILILSFMFFAFNHAALAGTERGGECTAGKVLCDIAENNGSVLLSGGEIQKYLDYYLAPLKADLPNFVDLLSNLRKEHWYIEPKPLDPKCNLDGSLISVSNEPVACQTVTDGVLSEVRIAAKDWSQSSPEIKSQIILHETLRNLQLNYHLSKSGLRYIVRAIVLNDPSSPDYAQNIRKALLDAGYGFFLTTQETETIKVFARKNVAALCARFSDGPIPEEAFWSIRYPSFTTLIETRQNSVYVDAIEKMKYFKEKACSDFDGYFEMVIYDQQSFHTF